MTTADLRRSAATVDLGIIRANAAALAALAAPAQLCAVVKADAYGHGAARVAGAALEGGATWLAVALVEEGMELRQELGANAGGVPVLVLSEAEPEAIGHLVRARLSATAYRAPYVEALAEAAAAAGVTVGVHVKVDTGMHRVGATPDGAVELARLVSGLPSLRLEGLMTHLACAGDADCGGEPGSVYTAMQLDSFESVADRLRLAGIAPGLLHAANSGGLIYEPRSRYQMVRCGIALYGYPPRPQAAATMPGPASGAATGPAAPGAGALTPAMSVTSRISFLRLRERNEALSYGQRYRLHRGSAVAVVPIGYADGVPWRLAQVGGEVLVGGRRAVVAGVTMDQTILDLGPASAPERGCDGGAVGDGAAGDGARTPAEGDEVVLIGRQGDDCISAADWAAKLGTISYEVLCSFGRGRLPRRFSQ